MANFKLLKLVGSKPTQMDTNTETVDFLSIKIGASALEIKETSGHFDFAAKKLVNIAAGAATGEAVEFDQLGTALADYVPLTQKAAANGVATLDAGGKIPAAQLPNSVMDYKGAWDASTNTPSLADGVGNAGDVYRASVSGTVDFGAGNITFLVGDFAIYSGTVWERSPASDGIVSVNGQSGVVVLDTDDISEGATNKYYTTARFNTDLATKTTDDLTEGATNKYYSSSLFDTDFATKTTDDLTEGSTNKYYTAAQAKVDLWEETFTNDNAGAITVRQVAYIKANGNVDLARADVANIADQELVIVKDASISAAAAGKAYVADGAVIGGFTGLTPGKKYYVSKTTAGAIALFGDITFAAGDAVYCVGKAISATKLKYKPEFEYIY